MAYHHYNQSLNQL